MHDFDYSCVKGSLHYELNVLEVNCLAVKQVVSSFVVIGDGASVDFV